jgi:hypothetical protein
MEVTKMTDDTQTAMEKQGEKFLEALKTGKVQGCVLAYATENNEGVGINGGNIGDLQSLLQCYGSITESLKGSIGKSHNLKNMLSALEGLGVGIK